MLPLIYIFSNKKNDFSQSSFENVALILLWSSKYEEVHMIKNASTKLGALIGKVQRPTIECQLSWQNYHQEL